MKARALSISQPALRDLQARGRILRRERGALFAQAYLDALLDWLAQVADGGAQLGRAVGGKSTLRVFGYKRHASVLAHFAAGRIEIVRVYFRGQDWGSHA
ncbi:MAG: hypothetical protein ACPGUV_05000 [Polyangiales bacterium]